MHLVSVIPQADSTCLAVCFDEKTPEKKSLPVTSYQNNDLQTYRNIRQQTEIIYQQTLNTVYLCCATYIPLYYVKILQYS